VEQETDEAETEHPEEDDFDEDFLEELEEEETDPGQVDPPHEITLAEYYNERREYDKKTIWWYEPKVFLLENTEELISLEEYFGDFDVIGLFGENDPDEDPDIRFVRVEDVSTDYEIVRYHRTWAETTGGSE